MYCWNVNEVAVSEVATIKLVGNSLFITGTGLKQGRPFHWQATQGPIGWAVSITVGNGMLGSVQGNGWDLPQEVAYAAKHFAHC